MRHRLLIPAAFLFAFPGWAQLQLKWDELAPRITNRKIACVLPDGAYVEGKVLGVEPDGLRLRKRLVPRQAISVLRVTEYRKLGRLLGTLGAVAAAGGIVAAQQIDVYEGPLVVIVPLGIAGGMAGAAIGGYYAGKAVDKQVTEIRVVPDPGPGKQ